MHLDESMVKVSSTSIGNGPFSMSIPLEAGTLVSLKAMASISGVIVLSPTYKIAPPEQAVSVKSGPTMVAFFIIGASHVFLQEQNRVTAIMLHKPIFFIHRFLPADTGCTLWVASYFNFSFILCLSASRVFFFSKFFSIAVVRSTPV